jgi:DNA-binding transcriptional regulator LsrR (DeoR family)
MMLANAQGGIWNGECFARALGITRPTVNRFLEFLEGSFMVRVLLPFHQIQLFCSKSTIESHSINPEVISILDYVEKNYQLTQK